MSSALRAATRGATLACAVFAGCLAVAACGSSSAPSPAASTAPASAAASSPAASAAGSTAAAAGQVPTSCAAVPQSLIASYAGAVKFVTSLGHAGQVSCEFASADAKSIVIVNIGQGTPALFAVAKAAAAGGGRTITPITGLGAQAFSISRAGVVRGVEALTDSNLLVSVTSTLTATQDESLIKALMQLF